MAITDKLTAIANAIRSKTGESGTMKLSDMPTKIAGIKSKETVTWHQCPEAVRNYIDNVTYNPADYSTSQIATYAPGTAVVGNTKPIGKTVDGVTYYNEIPNADTPFSSTNTAGTVKPLDQLRWINTTSTMNVRDLGGWACDGGTVKYGLLLRGGEPSASDKSLMVNEIGIRHELQLRGREEAPNPYSLWGIDFTCPQKYVWLSLVDKATWKEIIRCVFDTVTYGIPLYFHCAAGADRTGTVAVMLEALLGMSQSDIDKDYELTCFSTGTGTDAQARRRNEDEYKNYITAINAVPLVGGLTNTFRNRAVSFVLSLGFSIAEINAYRKAMIDGTPSDITITTETFTITKSGANVTFDNDSTEIEGYKEYAVNLSANDGYVISDVSVTMGGSPINVFTGEKVNLMRRITNSLTNCVTNNSNFNCIDGQGYGAIITANQGYTLEGATISVKMGGVEVAQQYYSNGTIIIPNVTGDVEISITAVQQGPSYTNIWQDPYKLNARLNSSEEDPAAYGMYISAWFPVTSTDISPSTIILRSNKDLWNYANKTTSGDYFRFYPSATAKTQVVNNTVSQYVREYDESSGIYTLKIARTFITGVADPANVHYFRFCAQALPQGQQITNDYFNGCILTINEPIT